jgi:hypothetical protein
MRGIHVYLQTWGRGADFEDRRQVNTTLAPLLLLLGAHGRCGFRKEGHFYFIRNVSYAGHTYMHVGEATRGLLLISWDGFCNLSIGHLPTVGD